MAGYTRQSTFADGDTITAALFNNEYNQVLNAFSNTGGHKHDGTANEGPVIGLIGDAGETSPNNKVLIDTTNNYIEFYVQVSDSPVQQMYIADGAIIPVTDSDVDLGTTGLRFKDAYIDTVTTTGNVAVGGNLTVTGTTTFNGGTITMGDAATDNVVFGADVDSNIIPDDDDSYDLGSSSQEWRNLYIDGTANIDSLVADTADINGGTIDGAIIGGSSAAAITGTAITGTSFVIGSATITEAELEILDGATVTTDELNILDGVTASAADINLIDGITNGTVIASKAIITDANKDITGGRNITISGELDAGSLDVSGNVDVDGTLETDALSINGTAVTSTAAELNILDGVTATAAEINALDGITSTVAELNILDGVTSTAAELNILDGKAFLDEDDMSSNSATGIASQQSIKAYVDTQITAEDLDITTDSGTIAIDLDSETLTVSGGTGLDSSATGNAVTLAIDSTVATLTGSQTLTNKSLTAPTLTGTAVVASLDISGDIDVDGTTNLDVVDIDGAVDMASTLTIGANSGVIKEIGSDLSLVQGAVGLRINDAASAISATTATANSDGAVDLGVSNIRFKRLYLADGITDSGSAGSNTVFNDGGTTADFRVESSNNANMLFVDGGNDAVGIGTSTPGAYYAGAEQLVVAKASGEGGITIATADNTNGALYFANGTTGAAAYQGGIGYQHDNSKLFLVEGGVATVFFGPTEYVFNEASLDRDFRVESNGKANMLFVDGGNDRVGIGVTPSSEFHVQGDANTIARIEPNNNSGKATLLVSSTGAGDGGIQYDSNNNQTHLFGYSDMTFNVGTGNLNSGYPANERMRIDSSGNVGIGVSNIGSTGLSLLNSMNFNMSEGANSSFLNIFRQASSAATVIANGYKYTDTANKVASSYASSWAKSAIALNYGNTIFYNDTAATTAVGTDVTPTERMRIDSSGNVGIGTNSPDTKLHVYKGSAGSVTALSDSTLVLENSTHNYLTFLSPNDKEQAIIFGDANSNNNASVGYNHNTDNLSISAVDDVIFNTSGATRGRFTDNGLCLGTDTAAANALDDYEEGSFTPSLGIPSGSISYSIQEGSYTKVGSVVNIVIGFGLSGISSPSGNLSISGLPFNAGLGEKYVAGMVVALARNFTTEFDNLRGYLNNNGNSITLAANNTSTGHSTPNANTLQSNTQLYVSMTYNTDE